MRKCLIGQSLVPLQLSLVPPRWGSCSQQPRVLPVSTYAWNLDILHSTASRNPHSADQPCFPSRLCATKRALVHQRENCGINLLIYLLQPVIPPLLLVWTCNKMRFPSDR
jgi:hypothetical protein